MSKRIEFHRGPAHCLKNTKVKKIQGEGVIHVEKFRRSFNSWFYFEFCKIVKSAWSNLKILKASQCSLLSFQQVQFCEMFLGGNDQEEDGFIQKYWKAHEADIKYTIENSRLILGQDSWYTTGLGLELV